MYYEAWTVETKRVTTRGGAYLGKRIDWIRYTEPWKIQKMDWPNNQPLKG